MAYVMLGRCEDINDLYIAGDFDPAKIKCEEASLREAERLDLIDMKRRMEQKELEDSSLKIGYLNTRSLREHYQDVINDPRLMTCDILGLGETWLHPGETVEIPGFNGTFICHGRGKGLASFTKSDLTHEKLELADASALFLSHEKLDVIYLYLSQNFNWSPVMEFFESMISEDRPTVIIGDVNWHFPDKHAMKVYLESKGFTQLIKRATHENGRIIDHLYISEHLKETEVVSMKQATYYSDHDMIKLYVPLQ